MSEAEKCDLVTPRLVVNFDASERGHAVINTFSFPVCAMRLGSKLASFPWPRSPPSLVPRPLPENRKEF